MTDRSSWNMARIASRRPLPKALVMHSGTVGERSAYAIGNSCKGCGFHICDCARALGRAEDALREAIKKQRAKKPDPYASTKAFLQQAYGLGAKPDENAVKNAIDKTLQKEADEASRKSRQELDREIAKLTPAERGNLNVACAELLRKARIKHAKMLENAGAFFKSESVVIEKIVSVKSGLVVITGDSTLRRSLVPASKLTW